MRCMRSCSEVGERVDAATIVKRGRRRYRVLLIPQKGGCAAEVPALPGCLAQGATAEQTLERVREAIRAHIAGLEADGEPLPVEQAPFRTALVEV